jgi:hypothetical protein
MAATKISSFVVLLLLNMSIRLSPALRCQNDARRDVFENVDDRCIYFRPLGDIAEMDQRWATKECESLDEYPRSMVFAEYRQSNETREIIGDNSSAHRNDRWNRLLDRFGTEHGRRRKLVRSDNMTMVDGQFDVELFELEEKRAERRKEFRKAAS